MHRDERHIERCARGGKVCYLLLGFAVLLFIFRFQFVTFFCFDFRLEVWISYSSVFVRFRGLGGR